MPTTKKKSETKNTLRDLMKNKLKTLYDVEQQLVKALPKMAKSATDEDLKRGFEKHFNQTEGHVERLERAFEIIGERPQKLPSEAMRGIIADAEWVIKNVEGTEALDAGLISAAQCAEYYEIAGYDSLIAWARLLDEDDIANLLQETLDEEAATSDELAELASSKIDERAAEVPISLLL